MCAQNGEPFKPKSRKPTQVTTQLNIKPPHIAQNILALDFNVQFIKKCLSNAGVTVYVLYSPSRLAMEKR
jgi:hypothetical protein